jgi:hypothetical protein
MAAFSGPAVLDSGRRGERGRPAEVEVVAGALSVGRARCLARALPAEAATS